MRYSILDFKILNSKKTSKYSLLLAVFIVCFSGCQSSNEVTVLKLAHGLDVNHPVHKGIEFMVKRAYEKSNGKLVIQIYPSAQLGNERECLELLQVGSLAITKVSAAVMENFSPNYKVLGLPYIFRSKEHCFKVLNGEIGEQLLDEGAEYRLKGLCFYDAGSRSFYTKEAPVNTPKDLEGLKIRVMKSNTAINMVNELGGSPTPISYGELYTALQQGVVDGAENNPPSFLTSRHYEVCKYYSLDEHTSVPDVLLISTDWWGRLPEQHKIWLKEAAKESVTYQRQVWAESEIAALKEVESYGVTVVRPDKTTFSEQVAPLYDELKSDQEISNLISRIKAIETDEE